MDSQKYFASPQAPKDWKPSSECPFKDPGYMCDPNWLEMMDSLSFGCPGPSIYDLKPPRFNPPKESLFDKVFNPSKVRERWNKAHRIWEVKNEKEKDEKIDEIEKYADKKVAKRKAIREKLEIDKEEYKKHQVVLAKYKSDFAAWKEIQWAVEFNRMIKEK